MHFAHGNGFPSACYSQLFNALSPYYEIIPIDKVGHHPEYPVTENWRYLVKELINHIRLTCDKPVVGLGHSLGGVLTFMAAMEAPELFTAVVMIDSPLVNRVKSNMIRLAKQFGFIDRVTPAYRTRGRRHFWQNREELQEYLQDKALFKTFTPACLNDYLDYGVVEHEKGLTLAFDRDIEYQIFRTMPHILPSYEGKLTVPCAMLWGDKSSVVTKADRSYMKKAFGIKCIPIKGTHMVPMEHPEILAALIYEVVNEELVH